MASPALETIFNCDYAIGVPQKLGFDLLLKAGRSFGFSTCLPRVAHEHGISYPIVWIACNHLVRSFPRCDGPTP